MAGAVSVISTVSVTPPTDKVNTCEAQVSTSIINAETTNDLKPSRSTVTLYFPALSVGKRKSQLASVVALLSMSAP
jgi:hypothetical protein